MNVKITTTVDITDDRAASKMLLAYKIDGAKAERLVIYEDAKGIVVGNTNASHGYLYVAGWLKPKE